MQVSIKKLYRIHEQETNTFTLSRLNSPEAKKAEKDAIEAIWMGRLEAFRDQSSADLDELEQLKNDSIVKMEVAITERDTGRAASP